MALELSNGATTRWHAHEKKQLTDTDKSESAKYTTCIHDKSLTKEKQM
jgi:hypothetical protein